jgi:electron transport protein HydN
MENQLGLFVVGNSEKCTGCKACEIACFVSHNDNNKIKRTVGTVTTPVIPRLYLAKLESKCMPIQCKQCEDAPCLNSCSSKAITKIDGVMVVNEVTCVGCKNCLMACPFGAIELLPLYDNAEPIMQAAANDVKIAAYKCDRCYKKDEPACVAACPHEALRKADFTTEVKDKQLKAAISLAASTA